MSAQLQVATIHVDKQQDYDGAFPLTLAATGDSTIESASAWAAQHRDALLKQLDHHGAILFRGFGVHTAEDFDRFIRAFDLENFTYSESLSNAVRVNMTERVFTANEAPPDVGIYFHHEMAQTPIFPSRLFFFCEIAADVAGQTPVCRSDILLERLRAARPDFVSNCERLGVRYTNVMPGSDDLESGQGRSWRSTLGTDSRDAAEARLGSLDYSWEWRDDGSLSATTPILPAVRTLQDGRKVFFNQLIAAFCGWADSRNDPHKAIRFGDDSPIAADDMQVTSDLAEELAFDLPWQNGDVVAINNFTVMHGRRPFEGRRRVLASLVADDGRQFQPDPIQPRQAV